MMESPSGAHPNILASRKLETFAAKCPPENGAENLAELQYKSLDGKRNYSFAVAVHDPAIDQVISKGILEGLFGPKGTYPSVDQVHMICEHLGGEAAIECGPGRVFVEVGSAIGMVSLYAASRGMKVYAFDPLFPNMERISASLCSNGQRYCAAAGQRSISNIATDRCQHPSAETWGPFSPTTFSLFWRLVGKESDYEGRFIESEPGNLAATARGGGTVRAKVQTTTIDESVHDPKIELMLLTCQGSEYEVRDGCPPPSNLVCCMSHPLPCTGFAWCRKAPRIWKYSAHHMATSPCGPAIRYKCSKYCGAAYRSWIQVLQH